MTKIMECLSRLLHWLCVTVMGLMTIIVIASVFLRYVLHITYVWSEEAITMLFITTTYFGAVLGIKENEHISVDFLIDAVPGSIRKVLRVLINIIVIAVQSIVLRYSLIWIGRVGNVLTPGLRLPIRYFYYMMPLTFFLIIVYEFNKLICLVFPKSEKTAAETQKL